MFETNFQSCTYW